MDAHAELRTRLDGEIIDGELQLPGLSVENLLQDELYVATLFLKEQLFESNFDVVIPALNRAAGASIKVSWNAVAAACALVFYWLYELTEDKESIVRHVEAFFGDPSSPMYGEVRMELIEHQGKKGYFARRAGCCLFWRVRDQDVYCSGCILLSDEEQTVRFKQQMASQV